ncbi:uncharacterized protein LOC101884770 [Tachysurus ichikawai]
MPRNGKRSESAKQRWKVKGSFETSSGAIFGSGRDEENPYVLSIVASHCQSDPRPRSESQLLTVKLKRCLCYQGHDQFQNVSNLPDEPMETDSSNENENAEHNDSGDETETTALDTCLQPPDPGQQLLSYDDGIFCIAPAERNRPESMAFPVQFPDEETPHSSREVNATYFSSPQKDIIH